MTFSLNIILTVGPWRPHTHSHIWHLLSSFILKNPNVCKTFSWLIKAENVLKTLEMMLIKSWDFSHEKLLKLCFQSCLWRQQAGPPPLIFLRTSSGVGSISLGETWTRTWIWTEAGLDLVLVSDAAVWWEHPPRTMGNKQTTFTEEQLEAYQVMLEAQERQLPGLNVL